MKLSDVGLQPDEDGKLPSVKGFILIDAPMNEEQINALKENNIILDKIIVLTDNSEEPGKILKTRGNFMEIHSLDNELAITEATLKVVKEAYGEDIVKEVSIGFGMNEFLNQILLAADPFHIRVRPFDIDQFVIRLLD